jgi:hypothetical protein
MKDEDVEITRQRVVREIGDDASDVTTLHGYPYKTLPNLESHLHPKFAIFDAGRKLKNLTQQSDKPLPEIRDLLINYPALYMIQNLYNAWVQKVPANALRELSYIDNSKVEEFPPYDDIDRDTNYYGRIALEDGPSNRPRTRSLAAAVRNDNAGEDGTVHGLMDAHIFRPKTRSIAADDELERNGRGRGRKGRKGRKVNKRKVLSESSTNNQHLLSEAALSRINEYFGEVAWTADRILYWSSSMTRKKRKLVQDRPPLS